MAWEINDCFSQNLEVLAGIDNQEFIPWLQSQISSLREEIWGSQWYNEVKSETQVDILIDQDMHIFTQWLTSEEWEYSYDWINISQTWVFSVVALLWLQRQLNTYISQRDWIIQWANDLLRECIANIENLNGR